ncbi:unnamed protein product [Porites lobata]|uniref:Uncharacterized protein n=1 Tax=Porites lobata TaxID=104759 RepID=A0ABN8QS01_9CNID|nr:unnamed protein product [Porites lobata]
MVTKESLFIVFALFAKFLGAISLPTEKESLKRDEYDTNAFSNDINKCLFTAWTTASGNPNAVLSKSVECKGYAGSHVQLCYGLEPPKAQFAACYNKQTLTPDFTGHIVEPDIEGTGREDEWREDKGKFAPVPQSKVEDYDPYSQKGLFDNYDIQKQYFLAKGHLTPNADFNTDDERLLTMITTNIAPQGQKFNSENWSGLERGVRRCASFSNRNLYVFTGVEKQRTTVKEVQQFFEVRLLTPSSTVDPLFVAGMLSSRLPCVCLNMFALAVPCVLRLLREQNKGEEGVNCDQLKQFYSFYCKVEPSLTAISVIRSPRYYGHFFSARQNGHTFPYKLQTPVNAVTRSFSLGGKARNLSGEVMYLKRRVLTPRWFWKAVCDPVAKQSIFFVGENSVGIASQAKAKGCNMIEQTKDKGIVYCMSHQKATRKFKEFKLSPFQEKNCKPSKKGTFMDNFLNGLK